MSECILAFWDRMEACIKKMNYITIVQHQILHNLRPTSYVIVALSITILAPWFGPLAHALDLSRKNQPKLPHYKTDQVEIIPMGSPGFKLKSPAK